MCIEKCNFDLLLKLKAEGKCPSLNTLVTFENPTQDQRDKAATLQMNLYGY